MERQARHGEHREEGERQDLLTGPPAIFLAALGLLWGEGGGGIPLRHSIPFGVRNKVPQIGGGSVQGILFFLGSKREYPYFGKYPDTQHAGSVKRQSTQLHLDEERLCQVDGDGPKPTTTALVDYLHIGLGFRV